MPEASALTALVLVLAPGVAVLLLAEPSERLLLWEALLVGVAWIGLELRGLGWSDVGLRAPGSWHRSFVLGAGGAAALLVGSFLLRKGLERWPGWRTETGAFEALEGDPRALLLGLVAAWVVGALGEELLYRGFFLDTIRATLPGGGPGPAGWWLALALSSGLFGLAHGFQGRAAVVLSFCIGIGYGALVRAGDTLWPAILAHGIYDTVAFTLVYAGLRAEGDDPP